MNDRLVGPLSGVGAVVLIFVSFVAGGTAPEAGAPIGDVTSFYAEHDTGQLVGAALLSIGALVFLFFAAWLAGILRAGRDERSSWAVLALCGGVVLAVGMLIFASLGIALGDTVGHLDPGALQALHVLNQELFFPVSIGAAAFLLGAGVAVLQTGVLPGWVGWVAVAAGVVAAMPSHIFGGPLDHIGFFGFGGLGVWTLIVSALLAMRERRTPLIES